MRMPVEEMHNDQDRIRREIIYKGINGFFGLNIWGKAPRTVKFTA